MPQVLERARRRRKLIDALIELSAVQSVEALVMTLRCSARAIAKADGIAVARREGDRVAYVAEDAVEPMWAGRCLPIDACVSGQAMLARRPILIDDVRCDARVPCGAYAGTFVRSMAKFPIGDATLAMGAYWAEPGEIDAEAVALLTSLACSAGVAFERIERMGTIRAMALARCAGS